MSRAIAHFGTFDVPNFGDLLFPLILEKRLGHVVSQFIHVSPRGGPAVWGDCVSSMSNQEFMQQQPDVDALVVGGGNIIHCAPTSLEAYQGVAFSGEFAYPSLWLNPTWISARRKIPLWWNGSGVSQPFAPHVAPVAHWACSGVDYLAVRDATSQNWLEAAGVRTPVHVIPDTALEISELWPAEMLKSIYELAFKDRRREVPRSSIVFHLNNRFLGEPIKDVAKRLDRICRSIDSTGILIALGPCHGDSELQLEIGGLMETQPLVIDQPRSLREVAACCAHSEAYIGSSLHGLITACSYGRRCMAVVSSQPGTRHKFTGFLEQFQLGQWTMDSWEMAEAWAGKLMTSIPSHWHRVLATAKPSLDRHWDSAASLLTREEEQDHQRQRRTGKQKLLSSLKTLLQNEGLDGSPLQLLIRQNSIRRLKLQQKTHTDTNKFLALNEELEQVNRDLKAALETAHTLECQLVSDRQKSLAAEEDLKSRVLEGSRINAQQKFELQVVTKKLVQTKEQLKIEIEEKRKQKIESQERIREINSSWKSALMELGELERNFEETESELTEIRHIQKRRNEESETLLSRLQEEVEQLREKLTETEDELHKANAKISKLAGEPASAKERPNAVGADSNPEGTPSHIPDSLQSKELQQSRLEQTWAIQTLKSIASTFQTGELEETSNPTDPLPLKSSRENDTWSLLTVVHGGGGGTIQVVMDLARKASPNRESFLLRTSLSQWELLVMQGGAARSLETFDFEKEWRFDEPMDEGRLGALEKVAKRCSASLVHVRHLIGNGPELIHFFNRLNIPVIFSFHDFYSVCPTIHLLDDQGLHCGGECTDTESDCKPTPHWFRPPVPRLKRDYVFVHRERMLEALKRCAALITTSDSTRAILQKTFPPLQNSPWVSIEHGRDIVRRELAHAPVSNQRCRVLCLGNLERIKGSDLLDKLLELDQQRGPRFEFHFVGNRARYFQPEKNGGVCHGRFTMEQLPKLVESIQPSFSLIASLWETYCHTLTESWAFGIPVVASATGALKERIEKHGGGVLVHERDPQIWYDQMLSILDTPSLYGKLAAEVAQIPMPTVSEMTGEYVELYDQIYRRNRASRRLADRVATLVSQNSRFRSELDRAREEHVRALEHEKAKASGLKRTLDQHTSDVAYLNTIIRIRNAVDQFIPIGAGMAVISKGDDLLLGMGPRNCRHFPADAEGNYLGYHPAGGSEAIAMLEYQTARGVGFLVIPGTSLWWMEHYEDFRHHLRDHATCLWTSEDCHIYSLSSATLKTRTRDVLRSVKFAWTTGNQLGEAHLGKNGDSRLPRETRTNNRSSNNPSVSTDYPALIQQVLHAVKRSVPANSVVSVISKGDNRLLQFEHSRAWHFPQTSQGVYAGHYPASDEDAIQHLENQRDQGAQYLVIPATYAWWLDHYKKLRDHLTDRYPCRYQDESCTIYHLNDGRKLSLWKRVRGSMTRPPRRSLPESADTAGSNATVSQPPPPTTGQFAPGSRPLDRRLITVVVPVYNAYDDVKECLKSLVRHNRHAHQVLLIDDCSPDSRIWPLLASYAERHPHIRILRNQENMGFTKTVNRGCRTAPGDVVILNSDTKVTRSWLEKLDACASSLENVGTVTPLSNAAGAFSVPVNNSINKIPAGMNVDDMAGLIERMAGRIRPSVPTGNGFCMFISRNVLNVIGYFDEKHFPLGYGEENDFCMRAKAKGFLNLIDDATFIYHHLSASFGESRQGLIATGRDTLRGLHPTYKSEITAWLSNDPLDEFRNKLNSVLQQPGKTAGQTASGKPCLLYVIHDGKGGTPLTNGDLIRGISAVYRCLLLTTGLEHWTLLESTNGKLRPLRKYRFTKMWRLNDTMTEERMRVLEEIKKVYHVDMVHVRHLLGNGPEVIHYFHKSNVPVVFSFHDYYTVCPTIQLIDREGVYCEGQCTAGGGDCRLVPSWFRGTLPKLKHEYVHRHREKMKDALAKCAHLITTCHSARSVIQRTFSEGLPRPIKVIEHGRDIPRDSLAIPPSKSEPTRVICLGNLDQAKGCHTITALMSINERAGRPFEFHFLGQHSSDFRPAAAGGTDHGRYQREDLPRLLKEIRPSFSLIASIWAETYCHTLTESWALGLPVFASHFGALKERLEQHGGGWLIDPNDPEACFQQMLAIRNDPASYSKALKDIESMPTRSTAPMVEDYRQLYVQCLRKEKT